MTSRRHRFVLRAAVLVIACTVAACTVAGELLAQQIGPVRAYPHRAGVVQQTARGMIALEFDDGWRSQYTNLSVLKDIKATFYVISGKLDHQGYLEGYMTPAQVQDLNRRGHEIGCHTVTHPD